MRRLALACLMLAPACAPWNPFAHAGVLELCAHVQVPEGDRAPLILDLQSAAAEVRMGDTIGAQNILQRRANLGPADAQAVSIIVDSYRPVVGQPEADQFAQAIEDCIAGLNAPR